MRGPHFIIGGAPKCGTTSLHRILACHPDIGIPPEEVNQLDADDPATHPDFAPSWGFDLGRYEQQFSGLHNKRLIGEDSTTYLFSDIAPARIKTYVPDAKLIFLLRDPVERAWSQYWHLVASGRCTEQFERACRKYRPIVEWSIYAPRLARYLDLFGPERIKILLFEDLVREPQNTVDTVTEFLGVEPVPVDKENIWHNRTSYPRSVNGRLLMNHAGRIAAKLRGRSHGREGKTTRLATGFLAALDRVCSGGKRPPMDADLRRALSEYLSGCNAGLSGIVNRPLTDIWPSFSEPAQP